VAPDGSWLATATGYQVLIWDTSNWTIQTTLTCDASVTAVAASSENKRVATGCYDGTVQIWDAITGQPLALMRVDNSIQACTWLDTNGLVVGGPAGLYLFDFLHQRRRSVNEQRKI
jgi:WD40 repeat protein